MSVGETVLPAAAIVVVVGEVDVSNVETVRAAITRASAERDIIVIDLSETTYIDSSTIALLVTMTKEVRVKRGQLCVVAPLTGRCRRVLTLSGVEGDLSLYETTEAALATPPD